MTIIERMVNDLITRACEENEEVMLAALAAGTPISLIRLAPFKLAFNGYKAHLVGGVFFIHERNHNNESVGSITPR